MVERRRLPGRGAMANGAVRGKSGRYVIRIGRALVILQMAAHAGRAGQVVVSVDVAIGALQLGMCSRDGETHRSVIEARRLPRSRAVAVLASLRESKRDVIRIGSFAKVLQVATHTAGWCAFVLAAYMTTDAVQRGMCPGKGEPGDFKVVEASTKPSGDRMALLASARESGGNVVGRRCLRIRCRVAGVALKRQTLELANCSTLVAGVALQRCMPAGERKPILVISDGLKSDLPALHGMAPLAIRAHLLPVNIGVTVGARGASVRKDRLSMALYTAEVFVQTTQRESGFAVIEFRNRAERLPTELRMAVLTGDV
jgi:hypothetical protein